MSGVPILFGSSFAVPVDEGIARRFMLTRKFADSLTQVQDQIVGIADDLEFLGQRFTPRKANRVGRSAEPTRPTRFCVQFGQVSLTPEQGQDFQHHARRLREGFDSGFAGFRQSEVQAETDTQTDVVVTVARLIPVTVGRAAVFRIVVPRTATQLNPVPCHPFSSFSGLAIIPINANFFRSSLRSDKRKKKSKG